jgi:hypothetical protein
MTARVHAGEGGESKVSPGDETKADDAVAASNAGSDKQWSSKQTVRKQGAGQKKVSWFINHKITQTVITLFVVYALFGEDIRVYTEKPFDTTFDALAVIALVIFIVELVCQSVASPNEYWLGFYFFLDLVSTASMFPDITFLMNPLLGDGESAEIGADSIKSAKASRSGAKAARFVRIVRLVRMVRVLKLYKAAQGKAGNGELIGKPDLTLDGGSKVGKKLTELTTRKVIILILSLVVFLPILDLSILSDLDNIHQSQGITYVYAGGEKGAVGVVYRVCVVRASVIEGWAGGVWCGGREYVCGRGEIDGKRTRWRHRARRHT